MTSIAMTDLYAFVAPNPDAHKVELVGVRVGDHWQPLVTPDVEVLDSLRPFARRFEEVTSRRVRLLHFTSVEEMPL